MEPINVDIPKPPMIIKTKKRIRETIVANLKYKNNPEYRLKELERAGNYGKNRYANDPVYRQKIVDNTKARYQKIKAIKASQ